MPYTIEIIKEAVKRFEFEYPNSETMGDYIDYLLDYIEKRDGHKPSVSNDLLCCPFCEGKATLIPKEDSPGDLPEIIYITCRNRGCELTDWIPYNDWQRRAT